jgi:hypothetical protein
MGWSYSLWGFFVSWDAPATNKYVYTLDQLCFAFLILRNKWMVKKKLACLEVKKLDDNEMKIKYKIFMDGSILDTYIHSYERSQKVLLLFLYNIFNTKKI